MLTVKLNAAMFFNYLILFLSILTGGLLTLYLGKDLNWDLANYHYYNPYALLHFRYDQDYWPASLNTYFNPTLDFLVYFLINEFPPRMAGFLLGAIQGITIWLTFKIALIFLPKEKKSYLLAVVMAALGAYCPQFICGIGMSLGDLTVGIFVLSSILLLLQPESKLVALSGLLLGFGIGLKYIIGFYAVGIFFALCQLKACWHDKLFIRNSRFKVITGWSVAVIVGISITAGYWMLFLWYKFHNPLFPFFNHLFHSPNFPDLNWHDNRFLPTTLTHWIFFPFYAGLNQIFTDDIPYIDVRFIIIYCLFLAVGVKKIVSRLKPNSISNLKNSEKKKEYFFLIFFITSFITWEIFSSFMRYAVILMMLAPIVIWILINKLSHEKIIKYSLLFFSFYCILLMVKTIPAERGNWESADYFGITIPSQVNESSKATVFFPIQDYYYFSRPPLSIAYLIPFFPKNWGFVGVFYNKSIENKLSPEIKNRMIKTSNPVYVLAEEKLLNSFAHLLQPLQKNTCQEIKTAKGVRRTAKIYLCELTVKVIASNPSCP